MLKIQHMIIIARDDFAQSGGFILSESPRSSCWAGKTLEDLDQDKSETRGLLWLFAPAYLFSEWVFPCSDDPGASQHFD